MSEWRPQAYAVLYSSGFISTHTACAPFTPRHRTRSWSKSKLSTGTHDRTRPFRSAIYMIYISIVYSFLIQLGYYHPPSPESGSEASFPNTNPDQTRQDNMHTLQCYTRGVPHSGLLRTQAGLEPLTSLGEEGPCRHLARKASMC